MRTKGKLIAFALVAGMAAYGTLARRRPDLKPAEAGIRTATATIGDGSAVARADTGPRIIKISASKFQFAPKRIVLKKGEPVTLQLTSTDRIHGFLIRALKIDTDIVPGKAKDMTVTPQVAGTFKAICDHYCGVGHGNMKMTVVVE
jgi:cytochrome c oxidase subunit 2